MQTARNPSPPESPGSAAQSSANRPAKKCDLPLPLPPHAALSLAGSSNGTNTSAVGICRLDNGSLNLRDLCRYVGCDLQRQQLRIDACPESTLVQRVFLGPFNQALRSSQSFSGK